MPFIKRLFGKNEKVEYTDGRSKKIDIHLTEEDNYRRISIDSIGFRGKYEYSKNKYYLIAWMDAAKIEKGITEGHRTEGNGQVLLIENNQIICLVSPERPNDCKVANNGSFIINDWRLGLEKNGSFLAYNRNGDLLIKQDFAANLLPTNAISDDGRYALAVTAYDETYDESPIYLFDLELRELVWRMDRPSRSHICQYQFNEENSMIIVSIKENNEKYSTIATITIGGKLEYTDKIEITYSGYDHKAIAEEYIDAKDYEKAKSQFIKALEKGVSENQTAEIYKLLGIIHQEEGENEKAIEYYEKALETYPKISGVKSRLKKLKNERI